MYVRMYVCVHVCMYVCMYVCVCVICIYVLLHTHTYILANKETGTCAVHIFYPHLISIGLPTPALHHSMAVSLYNHLYPAHIYTHIHTYRQCFRLSSLNSTLPGSPQPIDGTYFSEIFYTDDTLTSMRVVSTFLLYAIERHSAHHVLTSNDGKCVNLTANQRQSSVRFFSQVRLQVSLYRERTLPPTSEPC